MLSTNSWYHISSSGYEGLKKRVTTIKFIEERRIKIMAPGIRIIVNSIRGITRNL